MVSTLEKDHYFLLGHRALTEYNIVYYTERPRLDWTSQLPSKLKALVLGHTMDEGVLFIYLAEQFDFSYCLDRMSAYMTEGQAREVLARELLGLVLHVRCFRDHSEGGTTR